MNSFVNIKTLGVVVVAVIGVYLFSSKVLLPGPETLIEPIYLSKDFKELGYSGEELQHILIDTFGEMRGAAKSVTPRSSDNMVASDLDLPDIAIPGTGSSVRPLMEYLRSLLDRDASVSASVNGSTAAFSVVLTLRESNGDVLYFNFPRSKGAASKGKSSSGQGGNPEDTNGLRGAMHKAAIEIAKSQSPLTYAGY